MSEDNSHLDLQPGIDANEGHENRSSSEAVLQSVSTKELQSSLSRLPSRGSSIKQRISSFESLSAPQSPQASAVSGQSVISLLSPEELAKLIEEVKSLDEATLKVNQPLFGVIFDVIFSTWSGHAWFSFAALCYHR